MNFKKIFPNINQYIEPDTKVFESNERSHEGLLVPEISMKYGQVKGKFKFISSMAPRVFKLLGEVKKSYKDIVRQPENAKTRISESDLNGFLKFARTLGVDGVGYTVVDSQYIFKGQKILYENAFVLLMEMAADKISLAPSRAAYGEIMSTYKGLCVAANQLSDFLKEKGYRAQAGPALGGDVSYPMLAQKAGLGVLGKHGLLITPEFGPSLRIAAVYTDIENLPASGGNEHLWIKDFCNLCNRCVQKCPVGAIYKNTKIFDDQTEQHIDYKKCAVPFSNQYGCTICIKECLFFKEGYQAIKSKMVKDY